MVETKTAFRSSLPTFSPISEDGDSLAKHIQEIHADVCKRIQDNNERFKMATDLSRKFVEFKELFSYGSTKGCISKASFEKAEGISSI